MSALMIGFCFNILYLLSLFQGFNNKEDWELVCIGKITTFY